MDDAFENAMRTIANAYEAQTSTLGGKSLSRVATIVVNSGGFFNRLREGRTFSVQSLERFAAWFRSPGNWPEGVIPHDAATALVSIGRPPVAADARHSCPAARPAVACDPTNLSHREHYA